MSQASNAKGAVPRRRRAAADSAHRPALLLAHPSAELYGADRVFLESVSAAVQTGADVTVTLPVAGPLVAHLEERGARVVLCRAPVLQKSALRPKGFLRLVREAALSLVPSIRLIRAAGSDGVYVSTITVPAWLVLARLTGRRTTVHVHEAERNAPALVRRVMALPSSLAHSIIANSTFSLDTLTGPDTRTRRRSTVIYNGVIGPEDPAAARPDLTGPIRLLFIGRLSPRKGPKFALDVLEELLRRGVDAHLDLLGSVYTGYEWFEEELRARAAEPALAGRVTFLGFESDIWPRLVPADIVLIPSLIDEPFGNTAVEAILAARPLIASATSGLREAAAGYDSAQIIEPGNTDLWADAVQRVVADWPNYRNSAVTDAAAARERHSVARYRNQVSAILQADTRRTANNTHSASSVEVLSVEEISAR